MSSTQKAIERIKLIESINLISMNQDAVISQLQTWGLLQTSIPCSSEKCKLEEKTIKQIKDMSRLDFYRFKCYSCNSQRTLRISSIFCNLRTPLPVLFRLIFLCFAENKSQIKASEKSPCSYSTTKKVFKFLRKAISRHVSDYDESQPQLGVKALTETISQKNIELLKIQGQEIPEIAFDMIAEKNEEEKKLEKQKSKRKKNENSNQMDNYEDEDEEDIVNRLDGIQLDSPAVEIDESLFTQIVFGQNSEEEEAPNVFERQCWVIGIYDRSASDIRMIALGNTRNTEVVRVIVQKYVFTDPLNPTRVYTDCALFYNFLNDCGYAHHKINHGKGFGSGIWTTNHIESMWSQLKKIGKFNEGLQFHSVNDVQEYLNEIVWRWRHKNSCIVTELAHILCEINPESTAIEGEEDESDEDQEQMIAENN